MNLLSKFETKQKLHQVPSIYGTFPPYFKLLIYGAFFKVKDLKTVRKNIYDKHRWNLMAKGKA